MYSINISANSPEELIVNLKKLAETFSPVEKPKKETRAKKETKEPVKTEETVKTEGAEENFAEVEAAFKDIYGLGFKALSKLLAEFGAVKLSELKPEDYSNFIGRCKEIKKN